MDNEIEKNSVNFNPRIADFGLARSFADLNEHVTKCIGTIHWMAPEIFNNANKIPYTSKSDVYAFTVSLLDYYVGNFHWQNSIL